MTQDSGGDPHAESPQSIWQSQPEESFALSMDDLRANARYLRTTVRRRNFIEYLAVVYVIFTACQHALAAHQPLAKSGFLLTAAGALVVAYQLQRRASANDIPAHLPAASYLAAYRDELNRQYQALRKVMVWYIGPILPGMALEVIGRTIERHPNHWTSALPVTAVLAFVVGVVWFINIEAARRIRRRMDEVEAVLREC